MTQPAATFEEVTGAILIGGKSRRLGRDKVLLPYDGKPLAVHLHGILNSLFPHVLLIGHPRPELKAMGLPLIPDLVPDKGVLGGIYTALSTATTPYVFIAGADMPFLTPSLISMILGYRHSADAVIPRGPRGLEPLCAVYTKSCADVMEKNLRDGTLKIMAALENMTVLSPEVSPDNGEPDPFININYPEDLEILKGRAGW
jgi:molybdopterin-guanine dinucleotide biosynthesis protein A